MNSELLTIVTVIATGAVTALAQIYREGRARRWLEEDRARLAADVRRTLVSEAKDFGLELDRQRKVLTKHLTAQDDALEDTRDAAQRAYTEANHVNVKIANLTRETLELEKRVGDEEKR